MMTIFLRPSLQSSRHLAGVDLLVMYAVAYLRRSNAVEHPRPLLLLGAKGSGKTSIAKLVAEHIESDREVMAGECDQPLSAAT